MRIYVDVEEVELENDDGYPVQSVTATCRRCEHQTESFGTDTPSVKRCLALLRDECPNGESNFYTTDDGSLE